MLVIKFDNKIKTFSSITNLNYLDENTSNNVVASIKSIKEDKNNDDITDVFHINILISKYSDNKATETNIKDIKLMLFFDYKVSNIDNINSIYKNRYFKTESMMYFHKYNYEGLSNIKTKGKLSMNQKYPVNLDISENNSNENIYNDLSLHNEFNSVNNEFNKDFMSVYKYYKNKNITLEYNYQTLELLNQGNSNNLELNFEIEIPTIQEVIYKSSIYYTTKNTWLQYFYALLPFLLGLYFVLRFIYESNLVDYLKREYVKI